jgi:AmmeMemoRadiSam system protein A
VNNDTFDSDQLISIARTTIESVVKTGDIPSFASTSPLLNKKQGCFVTITIDGSLRGCIGNFQSDVPLQTTLPDMAARAAMQDPRFPSMTTDELSNYRVEISVLSPMEKISDPNKIEVGTHGLYLIKGNARGVLLPQVATKYHWDRKEFLRHTCQKAGIPNEAWRDPNTEIYRFSAEIISEQNN